VKVEVDVMARDEASLLEYAQKRGIPRIIVAGDEKRALLATADSQRWVSWKALEEMLS
jgi:histidyl-tRNA synthetase